MKKSEKLKKEKKKKAFIVFTLVIFLVSSIGSVVVYYGNNDDQNSFTQEYNGIKYRFKLTIDGQGNPYYTVSSKESEFIAFYTPQQIFIDANPDVLNVLGSSPYFYLSIDPESENLNLLDYLRLDIRQNLPQSKFFLEGVSQETDLYNLPVINCNNATSAPVIILKNTNTTNITSDGNCLNAEFQTQHAMQTRDLIVYTMQGIPIGDIND